MSRSSLRVFSRSVLFVTALSALADAQAVDPSQPLPPGHPAVQPTDDPDGVGELPAGHPAAPTKEPPQDRVSPAPDLKPGTIEVYVHDGSDVPLAGVAVHLGILKQDVGEGDSKSERNGTTDSRGMVTFDGLTVGTAYSYRATVNRDAAAFASESLRLTETGGQRVLLHVYPVTRDLREALVGARGVIFVEPREDVFQVEASFQILNIGSNAWVPEKVRLVLPEGAKAFRAGDAMNDARFDRTGTGPVDMLGTYAPGQHEVNFQFQLENKHVRRRSFRITLPPHVAELRLIAEGNRDLVLSSDGFPDAEPMRGQDGSRLIVTGRHLVRGEAPLEAVEITLDNLPVPGAGRWYAVAVAVALGALGLWQAWGQRAARTRALGDAEDLKRAEDRVLDELVTLERLHRERAVGPKTYEETRQALLDALSRLHGRATGAS